MEYILLVAAVAALIYLCEAVEKRVFRKNEKKELRRKPRQYQESEPEDLASRYHK